MEVKLLAVLGLMAAGTSVMAQDVSQRVQQALDNAAGRDSLFQTDTMENTVTTYETDRPEEADIPVDEFDQEAFTRKNENTAVGRAVVAGEDSIRYRQEFEDVSTGNADHAVEIADEALGGLFSSEGGGSCSANFAGGASPGVNFCTRILGQRLRFCTDRREITVDRRDRWRCEVHSGTYRDTCTGAVNWSCTGQSGELCRRNNLTANVSLTTLNRAGSAGVKRLTRNMGAGSGCSIRRTSFRVNIGDDMSVPRLRMELSRVVGVGQIRVNGSPVWTSAGSNGNLEIRNVDCGKRCTRTHVFAGGTDTGQCNGNVTTGQAWLTASYSQPTWSTQWVGSANEWRATGQSRSLNIEVLWAGTDSGSDSFNSVLTLQGGCCTQIVGRPQCN